MFKLVEDRLNAKVDTEYGVQTIILVEDSVRFYSSYLPLLYEELLNLNRAVRYTPDTSREK